VAFVTLNVGVSAGTTVLFDGALTAMPAGASFAVFTKNAAVGIQGLFRLPSEAKARQKYRVLSWSAGTVQLVLVVVALETRALRSLSA
jgi:hypothetical protein